jgi:hypothetical protein
MCVSTVCYFVYSTSSNHNASLLCSLCEEAGPSLALKAFILFLLPLLLFFSRSHSTHLCALCFYYFIFREMCLGLWTRRACDCTASWFPSPARRWHSQKYISLTPFEIIILALVCLLIIYITILPIFYLFHYFFL